MPVSINKEWAAVADDKIIVKAPTRQGVEMKLLKRGLSPTRYDIVALPDAPGWIGL